MADEFKLDESFEPFIESIIDQSEEDLGINVPGEHLLRIKEDGTKEWVLTEADIDCLSIGCGILGAGGGASPYLA